MYVFYLMENLKRTGNNQHLFLLLELCKYTRLNDKAA